MKQILVGIALALSVPASVAAAPAAPAGAEAELAAAKSIMMAEPQKALVHARAAVRLTRDLADPRARALAQGEAHWLEGEALTRINQPETAAPIIRAAMAEVDRFAPRSKLHADLLMSAATIDWMTGRVKEALAEFQTAHRIYGQLGEARSQAKALQYIGTIYFDARDYPRMLRYYRESEETFSGDPALTIPALNNQGDALKEMGRFGEAIDHYKRALTLARRLDSPVLEVRILTNLASAQYLSGNLAAADALADRGLARAAGQDTGWDRFLWGVKAQVALKRDDLAATGRYLGLTFAGADLATTTVQMREFHETAYRYYRRTGDLAPALAHLAAFKRLDDEVRDVAASTVSALLAARFDFTNQELSITRLKAGQLQRDIALERSRTRLRTITLYGLSAALLVAVLVIAGTLFAALKLRRSRNAVRAANDSLSLTNVALEKALKAKTEFLATTSHEIRTPLNGILGMTQVLMADRRLDPAVRDKVEVVHGAGETMRSLVDDILDVAKMETGEMALVEGEVAFRRLLDDAIRLWRGQAETKRLSLDLVVDPAVPDRLLGDEGRLRQILFNLMSNAIKFTDAGGVVVRATVEADASGEALVVAIRDTGIGIEESRHEEIFESFRQLDGGTDRRFGGTGLGLAICRNLVTLMRGSIVVESSAGAGATFTMRLPLTRIADAATPAGGTTKEPPADLASAAVLLVEGNPLAQGILGAVLGPATRSLETVADGGQALEAIRAGRADLLLIEANSAGVEGGPVLDGLAVLKAEARARGVPVAILFKPGDLLQPAILAPLGAELLLTKPIGPSAVVQGLRRLCGEEAGTRASVA